MVLRSKTKAQPMFLFLKFCKDFNKPKGAYKAALAVCAFLLRIDQQKKSAAEIKRRSKKFASVNKGLVAQW